MTAHSELVARLEGASEAFTMPHWHDPRVIAVANAIWDDNSIHSALTFPREEAVRYWPGIEARRFVAMFDALRAQPQPDGEKT